MRLVLGRLGVYLPAACRGVGGPLLAGGGPGLGKLRWPLIAAAGAAILAFAFSISWPLSFAGSYTRYESLPVRLGYLGLFAVAVWLLKDKRPRSWGVPAVVFGASVAGVEA